jgi:excisionase family DNA binding protein
VRHLAIIEAAESLQLSVPTIRRCIYDRKLKSIKLPGGQHRIPETEIARLLAASDLPGSAGQDGENVCANAEQRIEVLERWGTELEADVERLTGASEVVSRHCARRDERSDVSATAPDGQRPHRVAILGTGCKRCDTLYELATGFVRAAGCADVVVVRVDNLDDIAAYGPVLTPAVAIQNASPARPE